MRSVAKLQYCQARHCYEISPSWSIRFEKYRRHVAALVHVWDALYDESCHFLLNSYHFSLFEGTWQSHSFGLEAYVSKSVRTCRTLTTFGHHKVHVGVHVKADSHLVERLGQTARLEVEAKERLLSKSVITL